MAAGLAVIAMTSLKGTALSALTGGDGSAWWTLKEAVEANIFSDF